MKLLFFTFFIVAMVGLSCEKSNLASISNCSTNLPLPPSDSTCGCSTRKIAYCATFTSFLGYQYNGGLVYYTNDSKKSAWYIGVNIPNTNYYGICKICNPDTSIVRAFTDTSSRKHIISVKFEGALKKLCPAESQTFGFNGLPETVFFYITIHSIKLD